jgi:hypothetical protein
VQGLKGLKRGLLAQIFRACWQGGIRLVGGLKVVPSCLGMVLCRGVSQRGERWGRGYTMRENCWSRWEATGRSCGEGGKGKRKGKGKWGRGLQDRPFVYIVFNAFGCQRFYVHQVALVGRGGPGFKGVPFFETSLAPWLLLCFWRVCFILFACCMLVGICTVSS